MGEAHGVIDLSTKVVRMLVVCLSVCFVLCCWGCVRPQPYYKSTTLPGVTVHLADLATITRTYQQLLVVHEGSPARVVAGFSMPGQWEMWCSENDPETCGKELLRMIWVRQGECGKLPQYDQMACRSFGRR